MEMRRKVLAMLAIVAVAAVLLLAGCSASGDRDSYQGSPPPSGGGCGVYAPPAPGEGVGQLPAAGASQEAL